jgi:Fe2+-dicitrate sensor, membrane component
MRDLFKKYLHSLSNPADFDEFAQFVEDTKNNEAIYDLIKPEWDESLKIDAGLTNPKREVLLLILNRISNEELIKVKQSAKIYSFWLKTVAILVISLAISSLWLYKQSKPLSAYHQEQVIKVPFGAKTQFSMPDGSTVWLNSGSALTFSSDFSAKREVYLKGEAFFDIQKKKIPFSVNTDYGQVNVLGTAFNVQAYSKKEFAITLVRGSVLVKSDKQQATLVPGEQARLIDAQLEKAVVGTELYTSWKDGKLIFKREPFPSLMERLERWFNVRIEYSPNDFNGLWYSGTIENETITEVMEMISMAAPVKFSFDSKARVIKVNMK